MYKLPILAVFKSKFKRAFVNFNAKTLNRHISTEVVVADSLNAKVLSDFFDRKFMALRIPEFCTRIAVAQALDRLKHREVVNYFNAVGVERFKDFGMSYFEVNNPLSKQKYYQQVLPSIKELRNAFYPYLSPIDKIRLTLDEQWNKGASRLNLGDGPMLVGLVRALKGNLLAHEDKLERNYRTKSIDCEVQAAFNCYLSVPDSGGALQLWNLSFDGREYKRLSGPHYGISRSLLPPPVITIYPQIGELVIFNSRYLHAVTESSNVRVSASGFILYQGEDSPLRLWS